MLTGRQTAEAIARIEDDTIEQTPDGHPHTRLVVTTITDVRNYVVSGVFGDIEQDHAEKLAVTIRDDAHTLGLTYGDDWGPVLNCMTETEFAAYVDAALP